MVKSVYLKDAFNDTIREKFGEQIELRLRDQPMILRKQFFSMMNTIQEQEKVINEYERFEEKYQLACTKMREFGRSTRLEFSDNFRSIRADLVERKQEFKTHEAEVVSLLQKEKSKYEAYKATLLQQYEDSKLECAAKTAKIALLEEELQFEKDRAEFYLHRIDIAEKGTHEAETKADTAIKNLSDRQFLIENQKCMKCRETEEKDEKMTAEYEEMKTNLEKAISDRDTALESSDLFEKAAMSLAKDFDSAKYERDTFKALSEKNRTDYQKNIREKDNQIKTLTEQLRIAEERNRRSSNPRSAAGTPSYMERITPPEDGELPNSPVSTTPSYSTRTEPPLQKVVAQKVIEKKVAAPIAEGFASWIPKDKLDAPAPVFPKNISSFGIPMTPQQREADKPRYSGPCSQPTPWDKNAKATVSNTSKSYQQALEKARSDRFLRPGEGGERAISKSFEAERNKQLNERKRVLEEEKRKIEEQEAILNPAKKIKPAEPLPANSPKHASPASCRGTPGSTNKTPTPTPKAGKPLPLPSKPPTSKPQTPVSITAESTNKPIAPPFGLTVKPSVPSTVEKKPAPAPSTPNPIETSKDDSSIPGLDFDTLDEQAKQKQKEEIAKAKQASVQAAKQAQLTSKASVPTSKNSSIPIAKNNQPQVNAKDNDSGGNQNETGSSNQNKTKKPRKRNRARNPDNSENSDRDYRDDHDDWDDRGHRNDRDYRDGRPERIPSRGNPSPWHVPPTESPEKHWQRPQTQQYGIQSSQSNHPMDLGYNRSWGDDRSDGFRLPWHRPQERGQETPFGTVPIQDNFMSRPMSCPQPPPHHPSFFNNPRDMGYHSRDFYTPQPRQLHNPPPFNSSGPPVYGGPYRSFY